MSKDNNSSIIETKNLKKNFDDFTAVDKLNITVFSGEIYGFLGPNGAGKTTTIKMLTTLLNPTSGTATLAGYDIKEKRHNVRTHIGVVFQEPALDSELTGKENLDFHGRMYNLDRKTRQQRIQDVLQLVDLTEKENILVKNYSGGMKRRLEIARGLMHKPTILFLDEPTLGLDSQTRQAIWAYIKKLNKEHKTTIFLTTHYMDEADHLCDRISIIDQGKILVTDTPTQLKNNVGDDVISLQSTHQKNLKTLLEQQEWVNTIKTTEEKTLNLGVQQGEEKIPLVFELATQNNITIKNINLHRPTLDDVFIHYTGRTMRQSKENPLKTQMIRTRRVHR